MSRYDSQETNRYQNVQITYDNSAKEVKINLPQPEQDVPPTIPTSPQTIELPNTNKPQPTPYHSFDQNFKFYQKINNHV